MPARVLLHEHYAVPQAQGAHVAHLLVAVGQELQGRAAALSDSGKGHPGTGCSPPGGRSPGADELGLWSTGCWEMLGAWPLSQVQHLLASHTDLHGCCQGWQRDRPLPYWAGQMNPGSLCES